MAVFPMRKMSNYVLYLFAVTSMVVLFTPSLLFAQEKPWLRHTIDDSSKGADGVRVLDVNHDGWPDITTGWEEGGLTRVYLHPGMESVKLKWPAVTVGTTPSAEDAVFCDLDGDGAFDVVSSCEGSTNSMFVHWAPKDSNFYLQPGAWSTEAIPATVGKTSWMFAAPMQIDGMNGVDLVAASKNRDGCVAWLQAPRDPREMNGWKFHHLYSAGWIMSLIPEDVDLDGDFDLVVSDRKGKNSGVLWLEHPGEESAVRPWKEHRIGASGREVMFLDVVDLDGDSHRDVIAAVKPNEIHWFRRPSNPERLWPAQIMKVTHEAGIGRAKGIRGGDVDGDGRMDIVYSCEGATPPKQGVVWMSYIDTTDRMVWTTHPISGPGGIKFDRIELLDLDGDGDLDVLTCEERHQDKGLGVVWYENPHQ